MASISKREQSGKITYVVRWRDSEGQQRKRSFGRKIDASRYLTGIESSLHKGTYVDPDAGLVKVGEWTERWLKTQGHLKPSTYTRYEGIVRLHILPRWERVPLAKVRHADVAAWVTTLTASGMSPSSVRQTHRVFSLVIDLAVRDGRIAANSAAKVPLPRAATPDKHFLTRGQVEALAEACGHHGTLVRFLALTGLRFGEAAALRVGRVDLVRRRVEVAEAVTEVAGKAVFGTPKTHQRRSVPIPKSLVEPLMLATAGKGPDDYVFTSPQGGHLRLHNWRRRVFDPAVTAAGLEGVTPHDLRHTAASLAVSAGANVKAVQRMLGHASGAMTLDVYADLFEADLDDLADRIDDLDAEQR